MTDIADAMILRQLFAYLFDKGLILVATSNRYEYGQDRTVYRPGHDSAQDSAVYRTVQCTGQCSVQDSVV